jgi:hypothetical protein
MRRFLLAALTALTLVGGLLTHAAAQAAVARVSVTAEVVDPAVIDSGKLLAAAGGAVRQQGQREQMPWSEVQAQVAVSVDNGIQTLHIDYN